MIIHTGKALTRRDETRLKRYAESIIVKDAGSPERLLDETSLFLHRPESALPLENRRMLEQLHQADEVLQGKKVLIVDDDVRNVFALTSALEARGMTVVFAENGREGIARLEENPDTDLVLMDIMMPEMDGYETTQAIREMPEHARAADHLADGEGDEGRPREERGRGRVRLHHQAGGHGAADVADARVAVPVTVDGDAEREAIEIDLLLEAVHRRYAYDFRGYQPASLRRRLWHRVHGERVETISGLQERILHDPEAMDRLLRDLSINVTEMFRDPSFHRALRAKVFPIMRTYPFIRIWNAGCSTGRGAVLDRDRAARGGPARALADLRDRHQRGGARTGARGTVPARAHAALHRELPPRRRRGRVLPLLHRARRRRVSSTRSWGATPSSRSTTSCPTGRSTSSTSSSAAT